MPVIDLPRSVLQITHAMENFIVYAERYEGMQHIKSLSDFLTYAIGHTHPNSLFFVSDAPEVNQLRRVCALASKDNEIRKNLIVAIKEMCYKYVKNTTESDLKKDSHLPAIMVAQFHEQALKSAPHRISFKAELAKLTKDSYDSRSVLLLCIRIYNPKIEFIGDFSHDFAARMMISDMLKAIPSKKSTSITFSPPNRTLFGPDNRELFLSSIQKASCLILNGAELDRWTSDDFTHFLARVEANPYLTELSLEKTELDKVCKDSNKFPYLLKLLSLKQLTVLKLKDNNLDALPTKQLHKLQEAINASPIETICLGHTVHAHRSSTSSKIRLFDKSNVDNSLKHKAVDTSPEAASSELS